MYILLMSFFKIFLDDRESEHSFNLIEKLNEI